MFSVIIPTRDRASTLTRTLDSVAQQTHPAEQVVVVDDGSIDDTAAVLATYGRPGVEVVRTTGVGVSSARNAGLEAAQGEWVVFLDDDDTATPGWLAGFAERVAPDVGLICCGANLHGPDGVQVRPPKVLAGGPVEFFLAGTYAVRRSVMVDIGGYRDGLTYAENTELAMRLLPRCEALGLEVVAFPDPLVDIHRSPVRRATTGRAAALLSVIDAHPELFAQQKDRHARWLNVAAVDAWRDGDHRASRSLLRRAVRVQPTNPRTWGRLVAATVPPIGRRVWDRPTQQAATAPADR